MTHTPQITTTSNDPAEGSEEVVKSE